MFVIFSKINMAAWFKVTRMIVSNSITSSFIMELSHDKYSYIGKLTNSNDSKTNNPIYWLYSKLHCALLYSTLIWIRFLYLHWFTRQTTAVYNHNIRPVSNQYQTRPNDERKRNVKRELMLVLFFSKCNQMIRALKLAIDFCDIKIQLTWMLHSNCIHKTFTLRLPFTWR